MTRLSIGSLFSGIGGLELGLEASGLGRTVWQVEINPDARAVLAEHWPDVERFQDVKLVGSANLPRVDLVCGGFPCQDVSSAGKGAGLGGARSGLWFEYLRVVAELRPGFVVVENVASGACRWVDAVVSGLEQLGYACLPIPISASDCGAPHRRARVFIVAAHADRDREPTGTEYAEVACASEAVADVDGVHLREQQGQRGGAGRPGSPVPANDRETAPPDLTGQGREGTRRITKTEGRPRPDAGRWGRPEPDMVRVVHGVPRRMDGARSRIALLGNSVVPAQAEVVGWVIRELIS